MYREANQRGLKPQPEPVNIIIAAIEEVGVPANSEVGRLSVLCLPGS